MIDVSNFVQCLHEKAIDFFVGVPDSLLKSFCAYVADTCGDKHVIAANEGGAVGLAAGHYLATGRRAGREGRTPTCQAGQGHRLAL